MVEVIGSLLPVMGQSLLDMAKDAKSTRENAARIRRAILVELRCNLELLNLSEGRTLTHDVVRELVALLQLGVLQTIYGLETDSGLFLKRDFDRSILKFLRSSEDGVSKTRLPIDVSRDSISTALDYLLRKGIEMKAIASLSDATLLSLDASINWRLRIGNYRKMLLFTINNLRTNTKHPKT